MFFKSQPESIWIMVQWFHRKKDLKQERYDLVLSVIIGPLLNLILFDCGFLASIHLLHSMSLFFPQKR